MPSKSRLVLLFLVLAAIWCSVSSDIPINSNGTRSGIIEHSRRRKGKKAGRIIVAMIFAAILIKSVVFPLAMKAMAMMSGVSVVLSTLSLIIASMIGYAKLAMHNSHRSTVEILRRNDPTHLDMEDRHGLGNEKIMKYFD